MSATPSGTPAGTSSGDGSYIRGGGTRAGGGAYIRPRLLAAILIWLLVAVLAALAVYFAVAGSQESSRLSTLRHSGVPVTATVTGCVGISSGVGMGIEYWQCRADYTLAGQTFNEVINGNRALLETGQRLGTIAVPREPSLLSTVSSVRGSDSSGADNVIASVLGAVAVGLAAGWLQLERARRRQRRKG